MASRPMARSPKKCMTDESGCCLSRRGWISDGFGAYPHLRDVIHGLADRGEVKSGRNRCWCSARQAASALPRSRLPKPWRAGHRRCAGSDDKLAECVGTARTSRSTTRPKTSASASKGLTSSRGVDVVVDSVGGPYPEPALRSLAWRGRLVVGFAAGEIPKIPLNLTLLKGCSIVGVFWGDFLRREPERFHGTVAQLGVWWTEGKIARTSQRHSPSTAPPKP